MNPLVITVNVKSTVYCDFQLRWYPWDDPHCFLNLKVTNVPSFGLLVDGTSTVTMRPELLEEYEVVECRLQETPHPTNNLTLLVHLTRRYQYHLWTTFLPTSLLAAIGYGTLLLPLEAFAERGSMSLTTLLMFIALYTETNSSLPSTAYLKHIDVWFVFSLIFLTLVINVHLMTFLADSESAGQSVRPTPSRHLTHVSAPPFAKRVRDRMAVPKRILRMSTVLFALVFIIFTLVYFLAIV
ncbi:gamma-aminobutyric acid receptor subunit beta-1-like [Panulirus ornatus]|uniref:gamma-aminobutyric acid receptor subunit beta-1-like n=1 Tax=Panulirus ornatus TaxID=150431 RepID=UPI003A87A3FC